MQHKKSKAVAFTNSTNLGHGLSPSLCWPSVDGELQLLPSEMLELASVSFFLGFGELVFLPGIFFYYLFDYGVFQYSGVPRISVDGNRGTAIIAIFSNSRLVLLVCCEPWIEQNRPSGGLIVANAICLESLLLEVAELSEGNTQTQSHHSALLIFDINTVINF